MRTVFPQGTNNAGVTDLRQVIGAQRGTLDGPQSGPTRTTPLPFNLVAGQPLQLAPFNPRRTGLLLQNRDPAAALFYNFGSPANVFTGALPGGLGATLLLDYTCPCDAIWVFAVANCSGYLAEFSR